LRALGPNQKNSDGRAQESLILIAPLILEQEDINMFIKNTAVNDQGRNTPEGIKIVCMHNNDKVQTLWNCSIGKDMNQ